ncbi:hypothetical protein WSM22_10190 [Cytophagales bacterium WSM2-2]|nr:hypothetical protein WSM22_10190 [Cytophagales bacterium WSM2-2]
MNVLLTKKLSQDHMDLIKSWGWNFEVTEALKITLLNVASVPVPSDVWIISSRNSMEAVKKFITAAPKQIYCIGSWVKKELEKLDPEITTRSFESMKSLASDLARQNFERAVYFCGGEHRAELGEIVKETRTKISKVITHQSEMMFPEFNKRFDAIFVFSPRSAESILKHNSLSPHTIFACIGSTTADYLRDRGFTNTWVASYPDTGVLLVEFNKVMKSSQVIKALERLNQSGL